MGTKDYIDTVVLTDKPRSAETAPKHPIGINHNVVVRTDVRLTRVGDQEFTTLSIDESSDYGGDPYNSTGKHCVLKQNKR